VRYNPPAVLKAYFPALVFLILGTGVGTVFTFLNGWIGPSNPMKAKREAYECGLPSDVKRSFRFGISFYLIAMLFILFDIEVVFLYPVALQIDALGAFALVETGIFVFLLLVALGYVWRRGALEWK
jgi:NADH-quinone oxidoreductase subunit A